MSTCLLAIYISNYFHLSCRSINVVVVVVVIVVVVVVVFVFVVVLFD